MQQTKLIQYLSTLNSQEFKSFRKFLRSPYHNTNKQALKLLDGLTKYHPLFESPKLDKEIIFRRIHPEGKTYHEGRMNLIMSQLLKLLEQFFAYEELKNNDFQLSKLRMQAFQKRGLDKAFHKETEKLESTLAKWRKDEQYHLERFRLNREVFFHPATPRYQPGMKSLDTCLEQLDMFFMWEKLRFATLVFNRMRIFKETYEIKLLKEVTNHFEEILRQIPLLSFYEKLIQVQQDGDEALLIELTKKLEKVLENLEKGEQLDLFLLIYNLTSQKYRMGKTHFNPILLELNKLRLKLNLFQVEKNMNIVAFVNIAVTGSSNKEFTWTENFIDNYKSYLPSNTRLDGVNLASAYLSFYKSTGGNQKKELLQTIDFLQNIDFTQPYFSYRAKSLLLRTYYEYYLQKEENVNFVMDYTYAFERHITRNKSLEKTKAAAFLNFIKQTRKLIRIRFDRNRNDKNLEKMTESIHSGEVLFARNWLMEKVRELV